MGAASGEQQRSEASNPRLRRSTVIMPTPLSATTHDSFRGSFSAVSTPIFASKYSFFRIFRDLQNHLAEFSLIFRKFAKFCKILQNVAIFQRISRNFAIFCGFFNHFYEFFFFRAEATSNSRKPILFFFLFAEVTSNSRKPIEKKTSVYPPLVPRGGLLLLLLRLLLRLLLLLLLLLRLLPPPLSEEANSYRS